MATSSGILAFLDLLDEVGTDLGWVSGFVHDSARDDLINFRFLSAADVKSAQNIRTAVSKIVKARQEPSRELSEEVIRIILGILGDDALDECFTRLELQMVPEIVKRWKNLRAIQLVLLPTKPEVADYLDRPPYVTFTGCPQPRRSSAEPSSSSPWRRLFPMSEVCILGKWIAATAS